METTNPKLHRGLKQDKTIVDLESEDSFFKTALKLDAFERSSSMLDNKVQPEQGEIYLDNTEDSGLEGTVNHEQRQAYQNNAEDVRLEGTVNHEQGEIYQNNAEDVRLEDTVSSEQKQIYRNNSKDNLSDQNIVPQDKNLDARDGNIIEKEQTGDKLTDNNISTKPELENNEGGGITKTLLSDTHPEIPVQKHLLQWRSHSPERALSPPYFHRTNNDKNKSETEVSKFFSMTRIAKSLVASQKTRQNRLEATGNVTLHNKLRKFDPEIVKSRLYQVLEINLKFVKYEPGKCRILSKTLSETVRDTVKSMSFPRYKFVSIVTIGQKDTASISLGSRCIWNSATDNYASVEYTNKSLYAVALVFASFAE